MKKNKLVYVLLLVVFVFLGVYAFWSVYEFLTLKKPLQEVYETNKEFKGIIADVRYGGILSTKVLVFNLKKVPQPTKLSPVLYFLSFAKKMEPKTFDKVLLQYKGKTKFAIDGLKFAGLGMKAQVSPLVEVALELPTEVTTPQGLPAFQKPFGDEQWVAQKKIKNLRDFISVWYLDDWIQEAKRRGVKGIPTKRDITAKKKSETPSKPNGIPEIDVDVPEEVHPSPANTPEEIPPIEPESM